MNKYTSFSPIEATGALGFAGAAETQRAIRRLLSGDGVGDDARMFGYTWGEQRAQTAAIGAARMGVRVGIALGRRGVYGKTVASLAARRRWEMMRATEHCEAGGRL